MKTILMTGCLGQIGSELSMHFREIYGEDRVILSDLCPKGPLAEAPGFECLDVLDAKRMAEIIDRYKVDTVVHLAAILSAVGEKKPELAYEVNLTGLHNVLKIAAEKKLQVFVPSSIAAFGASTPANPTPQVTIQRPSTMYGVTKVAGELLCDYYHSRFGVDTRGVRLPGIISYTAPPGGGTSDYAVEIYYEALRQGRYASFLAEGSRMDMMYMPDALKAFSELLEANPERLKNRNAYNITAMSLAPEDIAASIQAHLPDFTLDYAVDPVRQAIADSWPDRLDDRAAREEWDWSPSYDLPRMTEDMLTNLRKKLAL